MRASSLGSCTKALVAERLGYKPQPPPEVLAAAFLRGHEHEAACKAAMEEDGYLFAQEGNPLYVWDEHQPFYEVEGVTCHLDGLVQSPERPALRCWEAKAPSAWESYERAHRTGKHSPLTLRYAWQSSVAMNATGLEQMVSCYDGERVKSFVIEVPPFTREQIAERVRSIETLTELPAECEPGCFDDWSCPFRYLHQRQEVTENAEIDHWVDAYQRWKKMERQGKEGVERVKAELEKLMVFDDKIETESSIVTKYEQASPAKWDMEKILAQLGLTEATAQEYRLPGTKSKRLKVTRKERASDE